MMFGNMTSSSRLMGSVLFLLGASSSAAAATWTREQVLALHGDFLSPEQLVHLERRLQLGGDQSFIIDELFDHRALISRTVEYTDYGVEATTTSSNTYVARLLQTHVADMKHLTSPIRQSDPLFRTLFDNIEQTDMNYENITDLGVSVVHTATTDCGVLLVQAHATQVTSFVDTGVRRPNFNWQSPMACNNPQPLDHPISSAPPPTPSLDTTSEEDSNDSESFTTTAATTVTLTTKTTTNTATITATVSAVTAATTTTTAFTTPITTTTTVATNAATTTATNNATTTTAATTAITSTEEQKSSNTAVAALSDQEESSLAPPPMMHSYLLMYATTTTLLAWWLL